jgi:hypothetical protein
MGVAPAIVTGLLDPMAYMIALGLVGKRLCHPGIRDLDY